MHEKKSKTVQFFLCEKVSGDVKPWVMVTWPHGLDETPVLFPFGRSAEECDRVREFIENRLAEDQLSG